MVVVTNLKQLTYRVPGTFKFNKSNFICNGNVEGSGGRGHPQNEQSGLFFYHSRRLPSVLCLPRSAALQSLLPLFLFFFISHFILFRSVPGRSLTFERVPRGPQRPVRANNTRKLHWDSFYLVRFFSTG